MASIADVFFQALLEDKELQVQAQKSGDKAGETLGGRMSSGISTAMRAGLGVVAGAAAIATKGLAELEDVTADFTAATGASADEAKAAGKAINEMAGSNLQPMAEIGDALAKVHTDLGQTGEAAEETTEDFLHFARVTKRDAAEEVAAFDDILDAWGMTAEDSQGIMDKLVASHQQYGGAIADDEAALASMAPQLKALNLEFDDGIELLNLFKSSGLDAAGIPKALNSAISKLDGRPLEDFIAELAGIEDPGKRAQRAIEVFGSKAGVGLANAIKPGMRSLDDFGISAEEAAGATDRARDAIDGTFSNRVQLAIAGVTAKIREFGGAFGPALTGVASLASLGGAVGLDRLVAPIVKAMAEAGKAGGEALIDGIGTATGAAGTVIGNLVAQAIDPHNPFLNGIIGKSAARIGALWGRLFGVATKVASVIAGVFLKLPGVGIVRSAVLASSIKIGTLSGTAMGTAAGLALRLGFLGALVWVAEEVHKASLDIAKSIRDTLGIEFGDDLHPERWGWPLGPAESDASRWFFNQLPESLRQRAKDAFGVIPQEAAAAVDGTADMTGTLVGQVSRGLADGASTVADGAETMVDPITGELKTAKKEAAAIAKATPYEIAKSLRDGADPVEMAAELLKDAIENALKPSKEIAALEGVLTGKALRRALNSKRPEVRAAAQAYKDAIEERLFALQNRVPQIALKTGETYAQALERKRTQVARAAQQLITEARSRFKAFQSQAYELGQNIGESLAAGLRSRLGAFAYATALYAGKMEALLRLRSPAKEGPLSEGGGPEGWAQRGAELYTAGWATLVPKLGRVFADLATPRLAAPILGSGIPGLGLPAVASAAASGAAAAAGDVVINGGIHVSVRGGVTNAETGNAVRQGVHDAMADVLRQQTARLPGGARS